MNDPAKTNDAKKPKEVDEKKSTSGTKAARHDDVILNDNFNINVDEPLPHLDKGKVKAYRAISGSRHSATLYALICDKSLTPRFATKQKYNNILNPNLCKLVQSGVIFWPKDQQEHYCFIYEDTIGHPIASRDNKNIALGWKPEIVLSNIVAPMIGLLRDLRNKELPHGEIWPGNLFDGGAKAGQKINLGECLSTPASSQMPTLFEPIERALADPMGRGPGDLADDLYSFGASLAVMLRKEDPMKGVSNEKIIEHKIEKGSYTTLLGKERLSGSILELLRGLLYDDPTQRWTLEDLEAWQDGRRLSPKQSPKRAKATRPILFLKTKYTRPELLAKDLHLDADEAVRIVSNNELDQWVERAIEDKTVKSRLEQAVQDISGYERGGSYNNRSCVAVANALYSDCCVRYRGVNFLPQGFGKYLTQSYVEQQDIEPFVDSMKYNFVTSIVRESRSLDKGILLSNFDNARGFLKLKTMNTG